MTRRRAALGLLALFSVLPGSEPVRAQQLGASTGGIVALDQARRFLGQHRRVLMIAAHPDDEDTELLTVLARGLGAETAYLALTRGEGGQNLIGGELGPALGVLRTEELLAARSLDGARQFFTRAYDFGFSKGLEDTWRFWPRDSVLKDVVRVVRGFRPQVIVAVFSGTPRDGHGQHQASGWAAREAFAAAGDPARFPELERELGLTPWAPGKLYQSARFDTAAATLVLQGGTLDPMVGQSYLQIAMRGRSLHRSQDMGSAQRLGPSAVRLRLVEDRTGRGGEGLFAGIDTSYAALLGVTGSAATEAIALQAAVRAAPDSPGGRTLLAAARDRLAAAEGVAARDQLNRLDDVLFRSSGVLCDAVAGDGRVVPGQRFTVLLQCWNTTTETVRLQMSLRLGGIATTGAGDHTVPAGGLVTDTVAVQVPEETPPTQPYYLAATRAGAFYLWPDRGQPALGSRPFEPAFLEASFTLAAGGKTSREVVQRVVDQAIGEVRRPLVVVPRVGATLGPASGLWPAGNPVARSFAVTLRHGGSDSTTATVRLEVPGGWTASPPQTLRFAREDEERSVRFTVTPSRTAAGRHRLRVVVDQSSGSAPGTGTTVVAYSHIRPRQLVSAAEATIVIAPMTLPAGRRIAYLRGAADRIPEALATLGVDMALVTGDSLAHVDLSRFGTIVVGPRAYETDPNLPGHNDRLLDFARRGGTVVVQYQQQVYFRAGFAPFALSLTERPGEATARVAAPRVAEEDAPVTVLDPAHSVIRGPNALVAADWDDWVQERGLYFARSWAADWTPLLEMADRGESAQRGGLLVARVGRGWYVYSGISFFRELPAAVPGATRLFLNLLALGDGRVEP